MNTVYGYDLGKQNPFFEL